MVITQEESISKGVRRIVAITGSEGKKAIEVGLILEKRLTMLQQEVEEAIKGSADIEESKKNIEEFNKVKYFFRRFFIYRARQKK